MIPHFYNKVQTFTGWFLTTPPFIALANTSLISNQSVAIITHVGRYGAIHINPTIGIFFRFAAKHYIENK